MPELKHVHDLPFFLNWMRTRSNYDLCGNPSLAGRYPEITKFWIIEPKQYRPPEFAAFGKPLLWLNQRKIVARFSGNFVTMLGPRQDCHDTIHFCTDQYNSWLAAEHTEEVASFFTITFKADHKSKQLFERYD